MGVLICCSQNKIKSRRWMDKTPQPSLLKGFVLRLRASRCRAFVKHWTIKQTGKKRATSNIFSQYVFRFQAQGEFTSSIQTHFYEIFDLSMFVHFGWCLCGTFGSSTLSSNLRTIGTLYSSPSWARRSAALHLQNNPPTNVLWAWVWSKHL